MASSGARLAMATFAIALMASCGGRTSALPTPLASARTCDQSLYPCLKQVTYGERIDLDGNAWTIVQVPYLDSTGHVTVDITIGATNTPVPTDTITFVYIDPTGLRTYEQGVRELIQPGQRSEFDRGWAGATIPGGTVEILHYGQPIAVVNNR